HGCDLKSGACVQTSGTSGRPLLIMLNSPHFTPWRPPVKWPFFALFLAAVTCAAAAQELTVQSIYGSSGLTGRAPDTIQWSPDGKKVSYFLHQEQGERADLYYIDVTAGTPAILVTSEKIAAMKPPVSTSKDDRERDNRERYRVAGYHWA